MWDEAKLRIDVYAYLTAIVRDVTTTAGKIV
jgi:hypothetical protein